MISILKLIRLSFCIFYFAQRDTERGDMKKILKAACLFSFIFLVFCNCASANNLLISNVSIDQRNPSNNTITINFDLSWENSWRTKINHDAIWLTLRLYDPTQSPTNKTLCQLTTSGLNPTGTSVGTNSNLEISVPSDKYGAFLRPSSYAINNSVASTDVQVTLDYTTCGFSDDDSVSTSIFGMEMVYIPEGPFYVGDYNESSASLNEGSSDTDPWYISSASAINVSDPASNGYRYVSGGNDDEEGTGASFVLPDSFPKGYSAFYVMKYELTEGQWVEFLNSLPSSSYRENRDITDATHKNTDTVIHRNTISCSGSSLTCSTSRPARALNYISWMDLSAFLDWLALRPLSELEFEKITRGSLLPVSGEFAWGTTSISAATSLSSGDESGIESIATDGANAHYGNVTLTGGDTLYGADYAQGPLRGGIFATLSSTRETAGASYYGVMDMSGNLSERVVTIGNSYGQSFTGNSGDGLLSSSGSYAGNANQESWPGLDVVVSRGVTGALGSGFRGGGWDQSNVNLRISDRSDAARASTSADKNAGGRGARTYSETY